jgi:hypothetical protein
MVLAAIVSQSVSLAAWSVYLPCDVKAASIQTRFRRWLNNAKIDTQKLYDILIRHALQNWKTRITLTLDTSMLRDKFCMINISVIYKGRAFSISWRIIKHNSSSVKFEEYQEVLEQARSRLPDGIEVVFLADRGFVSQKLMKCLNGWGWNWRIRIKGNQSLRCQGKKIRPQALGLRMGDVILFDRNISFGHGLRRLSLLAGWSRGIVFTLDKCKYYTSSLFFIRNFVFTQCLVDRINATSEIFGYFAKSIVIMLNYVGFQFFRVNLLVRSI